MRGRATTLAAGAAAGVVACAALAAQVPVSPQRGDGFRYQTGIDLVNVTATVTDEDGRFVSDLARDDFTVYEDGQRQEITHLSLIHI